MTPLGYAYFIIYMRDASVSAGSAYCTTLLPTATMSSDPYAGDPTHLRWIVPVLTITNSDGSEDAGHPQVGVPIVDKFGARRTYEEANEKTEKLWLRKTANYLVYESRMSLSSKYHHSSLCAPRHLLIFLHREGQHIVHSE